MSQQLQRTEEWMAQRRGLPSASNANKMMTPTGSASKQYVAYAYELASDRWLDRTTPGGFGGNIWTERGVELEPHARAAFELDQDLDVVECGAIVAGEGVDGSYCASPDGLVGEDGVLEIKCLKHVGHINSMMEVHRTGLPPAEYRNQMRMQMLCTNRDVGYFVAYHPDFPLVVARLERDADIEAILLEQIHKTLGERDAVLELLDAMSHKITRSLEQC